MHCSKLLSMRSSAPRTLHPQRRFATPSRTSINTVVGPVKWGSGPVKNVAKTPLVGGQWRKGGQFKYDLVIVDNSLAKNIPVQDTLKPIGGLRLHPSREVRCPLMAHGVETEMDMPLLHLDNATKRGTGSLRVINGLSVSRRG